MSECLKVFRPITFKNKVISGGIFFICTLILVLIFFTRFSKPVKKTDVESEKGNINTTAEIISALDKQTPIDLIYNSEVEHYISLYTGEKKSELSVLISRSELYFPIIESYLDKYDLPLELKYVSVIESGLNPKAKSKSGAVGLWQFLYNTCDLLSLNVTSYIDERCNVYKSTDAACRYFQYLYRTFNDWNLVMAAYNGGPGEVRKAIERSGGETDYWKLRPYLSDQAADYIPKFTAVFYCFSESKNLGINIDKPLISFTDIDTLWLKKEVLFEALTSELGLSSEELELLNPEYKTGKIPFGNKQNILILPKDKISLFLQQENKIYNYKRVKENYNDLTAKASSTTGRKCIIHEVQEGDYCHKLAIQYNCTIENIKAWNELSSINIKPGQKLKIWVE